MPLQPPGTPQPQAPQGTLKQSPHLQKYFFLAYTLQQYRNTLLYTETWRCRSSGSGAVPIPITAGAAVLAPHRRRPTASPPGAGSRGLAGAWQLPTAPTTPLACTGDPGYPACPRAPSRPGRGEWGEHLPSAIAAPPRASPKHSSPLESCFPAAAVLPTTASCC